MDYRRVEDGREYVARLEHGRDWRGQIEAFAETEAIDAAFFFGLGAVQDATLSFYDQDDQVYESVSFAEPFEVTAAVGNVSHLESEGRSRSEGLTESDGGERFAHTHVTLTREDGSAIGGHLDEATTFAGELYVRAFEDRLDRTHDETTDLDLWPL
jgi:predicted DNA-binding protein with PD1-like motif